MPPSEIYVCDADCLINLHRHFGRKALSVLRRLAKAGGFKLPEGVIRELIRGTDILARFVQSTGSISRSPRAKILRCTQRFQGPNDGMAIKYGLEAKSIPDSGTAFPAVEQRMPRL